MNNKITELVFILDKSGSMAGLEEDTIGGFNAMLKKQNGDCYVTTVLFNGEYNVIHDRLKLADVPEMTMKDYDVCGCTALYDAVGSTIEHIEQIHKYIRTEDVPEQVMFVITTDGMENASKRFNNETVKALIEKKKSKSDWEFVFIGANIDSAQVAEDIGIGKNRSANYISDKRGTKFMFNVMSDALCDMCEDGDFNEEYLDVLNIFADNKS